MRKRIFASLLSVLLAAACLTPGICPTVLAVDAEPTISIAENWGTPNRPVRLSVRIENNPGIVGIKIGVTYDTSVLFFTKASNGSVFYDSSITYGPNLDSGDFYVMWMDEKRKYNYVDNDILLSLEFDIRSNAPYGDSPVTLTFFEAINVDKESVSFSVRSGKVEVLPPVIPVESVQLAPTMEVNFRQSAKLTATVLPENASDKSLTWSSSDQRVLTVDGEGNITTHKRGVSIVTAVSAGGKHSQCKVTVNYFLGQWLIVIFLFGWIWYK